MVTHLDGIWMLILVLHSMWFQLCTRVSQSKFLAEFQSFLSTTHCLMFSMGDRSLEHNGHNIIQMPAEWNDVETEGPFNTTLGNPSISHPYVSQGIKDQLESLHPKAIKFRRSLIRVHET
ncbi:hypothetical protein NPIL_134401 [Nephila pilipes]|uniref:Uncharacterized protein n=1 Tax=Nephila pilipes TaxID=299642 RepID=A0A8X6N2K1_NEPPI|nr:hypothetical protein NPIL_134401 [Nephila pilipes]